MEDVSGLVLEEDAHPLTFSDAGAQAPVVVDGARLVGRRERDAVVEVEVGLGRGDPLEAPTHPFLVRRELGERSTGDGDEGDIPSIEVDDVRVEVVGPEGAALAADIVFGSEHEVVDDELALVLEELGERLLALRAFEDVVLLDPLPRQLASCPA